MPLADHPGAIAVAGEHLCERIRTVGPIEEVRIVGRARGVSAGERLRPQPVVDAVGRRHPPGGEARAGRRADRGGAEEVLEGGALPLEPIERRGVQLGHPRAHRPGALVVGDQQQHVRAGGRAGRRLRHHGLLLRRAGEVIHRSPGSHPLSCGPRHVRRRASRIVRAASEGRACQRGGERRRTQDPSLGSPRASRSPDRAGPGIVESRAGRRRATN